MNNSSWTQYVWLSRSYGVHWNGTSCSCAVHNLVNCTLDPASSHREGPSFLGVLLCKRKLKEGPRTRNQVSQQTEISRMVQSLEIIQKIHVGTRQGTVTEKHWEARPGPRSQVSDVSIKICMILLIF